MTAVPQWQAHAALDRGAVLSRIGRSRFAVSTKQPRSMTVTALAVLGLWFLRDCRLGLGARGRATFGDWARYHDVRPGRAEAPGYCQARTHHAKRNCSNCNKAEASDEHFGSPCPALGSCCGPTRIDPGTRCRNRSLPEQNGSVPYQQRSRHVPSIEGHLFVAALLNRLYYAADRDRLARN